MKEKRLDRDGWGFQHFPYYQFRMDTADFHGLVGVIDLIDGEDCFWELPAAGKTPVCGKGMQWLQLIPDGAHRVITAKFLPEASRGIRFPKAVSIWYVDVIDRWGYAPDGVACFVDQYLDVIFDPEGDVVLDDRDELDDAYRSGELSAAQYRRAIAEGDAIVRELCADISKTQDWCTRLLREAMARIQTDPDIFSKNAGIAP